MSSVNEDIEHSLSDMSINEDVEQLLSDIPINEDVIDNKSGKILDLFLCYATIYTS